MCGLFEELQVVMVDDTSAVRIRVSGELDIASVDTLRTVLNAAAAAGDGDVELDMSTTRFCDSVGLCALADARHRLHESGRPLRIIAASDRVRRVLELSGMSPLFGLSAPTDQGGVRDEPARDTQCR
jgi:anti-sigma B factor antagonist